MTPPDRFRGLKIALGLVVVIAVLAGVYVGIRSYVRSQWYVGDDNGHVAVFRGVPGAIAGLHFNSVETPTDISVATLPDLERDKVESGVPADNAQAAGAVVDRLRTQTTPPGGAAATSTDATPTPAVTSAPASTPAPPAQSLRSGAARRTTR
jgi:protein phosphatase